MVEAVSLPQPLPFQLHPPRPLAPMLVLAGPTASGKSALAMVLAERFGGEIVSCDSVAVYRGMDIGSAKPSAEDRARVPHHGLDLFAPEQLCTAGDYARAARASLAAITARGRLPIVAGGTGLYLRALLEGLSAAPPRDEALRDRLRASAARHGEAWLHSMLRRLDADAAAAVHANDATKLIRALEMSVLAGRPQTEQWAAGSEALQGYRVLELALGPPRAELYERINARAAAMFERGLVEETRALAARCGEPCTALGALGYAQALAEIRGELTRAEAVAAAQQGHRNYAKRQLTWFRGQRRMHWLAGFGEDAAVAREASMLVETFLAVGS
jgi:tRNA dimethylallyltransferase